MRVRRAARGFTLIEILVAMGLTLAVFAITLPFLRVQTRALGLNAGRLDAEQIARYAQRAIDRDLRLATADAGQPLLVLAGPMAVSFNANLVAADATDPDAVDVAPGAATTLTDAWRLPDAAVLPRTARAYPTQDYLDADGVISRNETISYFLHPDTVSGQPELYVLYRRVNARDSVQIVRSLHVPADSAFFSYHRSVSGTLARIAEARLPLYWDSTAIDSVQVVGIRAAGFYRNNAAGTEVIRTVPWRTVVPNARGRTPLGCPSAPGAASSVGHDKVADASGYRVEVGWDASGDDGSGTEQVTHYLVGQRLESGTEWQVIAAVPARGTSAYRWDHHLPSLTGSVKYGVRAIGCGGASSAWVTHGSTLSLP